MYLNIKHILLTCFLLTILFAQAQLVNINGVHVQISVGAEVQVNGDIQINDSTLYNLGDIHIDGSLTNNGIVYGGDYAEEHGYFHISGNWKNEGTFKHGLGTVNFNGQAQTIGGTNPTAFFNMETHGAFAKTLSNNIEVHHFLRMYDAELALDDQDLQLHFVDVNALQRTSGFVSTENGGRLIRRVLLPEEYLFPFGNQDKYLPVSLQAYITTKTDTNTFALSLYSQTPANPLQLDSMMCFMNEDFYYWIDQTEGTNKTDIIADYTHSREVYRWNKIVHWTAAPNNVWKNTELNQYQEEYTPGNDRVRTMGGWNDFTPQMFALAYVKPVIDDLAIIDEACMGKDITRLTVNDSTSPALYNWDISGGDIVNNYNSSVDVVWNQVGTGTVSVSAEVVSTTGSGRCYTNTISGNIAVRPQPIATIVTDTNNVWELEPIHFMDTINTGLLVYWDFADGYGTSEAAPYHKYEKFGRYPVTYTVENQYGCADTTTKLITIRSGVIVPNVFTPNYDGINDYFRIKNSGMTEFTLQIYNRWGALIFQTNNPHTGWDGKTMAGLEAPSGTYYYVYKGNILDEVHEGNGSLSLLRD